MSYPIRSSVTRGDRLDADMLQETYFGCKGFLDQNQAQAPLDNRTRSMELPDMELSFGLSTSEVSRPQHVKISPLPTYRH